MNSETPSPKDEGIGALLKNERERKKLSREYASRITRLRLHYIEALEEENWQALPEPVFIKGFIRSYAQFLRLDYKSAVALYEARPDRTEVSVNPLVVPKQGNRIIIFLPLLVLAVIAFVLFFWFRPVAPVPAELSADSETREETLYQDQSASYGEPVEKPEAKEPDDADQDKQETIAEAEETLEPQNTVTKKQETTKTNPDVVEPAPAVTPAVADQPQPIIPDSYPGEKQLPAVTDEIVSNQPYMIDKDDPSFLTLDGIVNMRTYIKIYVDDQPAKEYIFQPGSRPQWKGQKGFNIIVGNAAGIEFLFNGKNRGSLGVLGQVIRIRFPEEFEASTYEE